MSKKGMPQMTSERHLFRSGDHWVWLSGAGTIAVLLCFALLIFVVAFHGLRAFWVPDVGRYVFQNGEVLFAAEMAKGESGRRQLYTANRERMGLDFRQVEAQRIQSVTYPADLTVLERTRNGPAYGVPVRLALGDQVSKPNWSDLQAAFSDVQHRMDERREMRQSLHQIDRQLLTIRQKMAQAENAATADQLRNLTSEYTALNERIMELNRSLDQARVILADASDHTWAVPLVDVLRMYRPNQMGVWSKLGLYIGKLWELLTDYPRESNTAGGVFPAIFGTVLMVFLMSLFSVPLGVLAAVYLREYAKDGVLVRLVRIAVNNLAGVPSIVYGMFGLGFFVYGIGGQIDSLFYSDQLPTPTYGTGGLLWASLTMALLTVPVVIISTEEGLNTVPPRVRKGSYALGATKLQTLVRVVLPMSTPGMLTGLILAIARAAGEVAPLMFVGVVKSVPTLAVDGDAPFLHLERKFMHLGYHIFDVGFQSPNVEAAKPMVYVITLLLLFIVLGLSYFAMYLRHILQKRYSLEAF